MRSRSLSLYGQSHEGIGRYSDGRICTEAGEQAADKPKSLHEPANDPASAARPQAEVRCKPMLAVAIAFLDRKARQILPELGLSRAPPSAVVDAP